MKAYTDYPLQTNPQSNVVEIQVLSYDRNKYATIRHEGEEEEIKTGYIWKDPELTKRVSDLCFLRLPVKPWDKAPSKLKAYREYKKTYRHKRVSYTLYRGSQYRYYSTLDSALKAFSNTVGDCYVIVVTVSGYGWSTRMLLSREKGQLYAATNRRHPTLNPRHLKKYKIPY